MERKLLMSPVPLPPRPLLNCLVVVAALVFGSAVLGVEDLSDTYTRPTVPSREALDRLNLKIGWSLNLPVESMRDGIFSVQVLEKDLFVQTRGGVVLVIDAETGEVKWRTRVGLVYRPVHPVGYNSKTVFVVSDTDVYALDRTDGKTLWVFRMPGSAAAPPIADEERLFLNVGKGRLYAYHIPTKLELEDYAKGITEKKPELPVDPRAVDFRKPVGSFVRGRDVAAVGPLSSAREVTKSEVVGPQPREEWSYITNSRVEKTPLQTEDTLLLAEADGTIEGVAKTISKVVYSVPLERAIALQPGQHGKTAYIAAQDSNLYAGNMETGQVLWRFTDGNVYTRPPAVTDKLIFLATARKGLYCLGREDGDLKWRSPSGGRFIATNSKFVYAADRSDRFLVLDRERGTVLSTYDLRDFVFPIVNERTDRIYLAAHNGLLLCLHDRDIDKPQIMKKGESPGEKPGDKPGDKPGEKPGDKPGEKPADKPGDKDKPMDKDSKVEKKG
jgi:outer membrane protein assembly factor BamB